MKRLKIIAIVLALTFSNIFSFEKVGTTSFQFLKILPGARGSSLGYAYGSLVNNSEAVFYNPAGLSSINNTDFSLSYIDWFMDAAHYGFSGAYNLSGYGTFALQIIYVDYGTIEETKVDALGFIGNTYNPGLTGVTYRPSAFVAGISYSRNLTDKLSMGITAKYISENLIYKKVGTFAFDGGLIFNTGFKGIKLEAAIRHFGPEIKYIEKSYPLPQTFSLGFSANLLSNEEFLIYKLQDQNFTISYAMVQPRDFDQQHNVGVEYSFKDFFFLRGGYQFNSDQETFSLGAGVNYQNIRFDYSFNKYGEYLNAVHRLTLGFSLN